jgi:hypothetical protein
MGHLQYHSQLLNYRRVISRYYPIIIPVWSSLYTHYIAIIIQQESFHLPANAEILSFRHLSPRRMYRDWLCVPFSSWKRQERTQAIDFNFQPFQPNKTRILSAKIVTLKSVHILLGVENFLRASVVPSCSTGNLASIAKAVAKAKPGPKKSWCDFGGPLDLVECPFDSGQTPFVATGHIHSAKF